MICPEDFFVYLRKLREVLYICENYVKFSYVLCLQTGFWYVGENFFGISGKKFWGPPPPPPPPARQQFWGEILMFNLPVQQTIPCAHPKQD
jgi:hypothetical protein